MDERERRVLDLLDRSGARLHALLARLTYGRDAAGDLIQELFLKLCQSKGFARAGEPEGYAVRVAINLAMDWRRAKKRRMQPLSAETEPPADQPSVLDKMVRREEIEALLNAIARLNRLPREVIILRYLEQESYEKISERLGKKPAHLRSICSKSLAQLRKYLDTETVHLLPKE